MSSLNLLESLPPGWMRVTPAEVGFASTWNTDSKQFDLVQPIQFGTGDNTLTGWASPVVFVHAASGWMVGEFRADLLNATARYVQGLHEMKVILGKPPTSRTYDVAFPLHYTVKRVLEGISAALKVWEAEAV